MIADQLTGVVKLNTPVMSGYYDWLFSGAITYKLATDEWSGILTDQVGHEVRMRTRFACDTQLGYWALENISGLWTPGLTWSAANISYRGGQMYDTHWLVANAPGQNPNWTCTIRSYL